MKNQIQKCNGLTPISFILFCLLVLPPLGGLEGGFIFAFLGAGEVLFSNSRF